jgi:hypothetical protein
MVSYRTRFAFLFIAFLMCGTTNAQQHAATPRAVSAWIPSGWKVLDSASGTINNDSFPDLVLAIESPKEKTLSQKNARRTKVHPRQLLVLFGSEGGNYMLHFSSNTLIPYKTGTWEPLEKIAIDKRGQLLLGFAHQFELNSEYGVHVEYRFRFESGQFRLIGADYHGNTGREPGYVDYSYNFLTGRRSEQKTSVDEDGNEKTGTETWKRFPNNKPILLEGMKYPFSIEMKADGIGL